MQIIQLSDLHINSETNISDINKKIDKLYIAIEPNLRNDDCLVFTILGDIVDKGDSSNYEIAVTVFKYIEEKFIKFKPTFEFTPGNHDLCGCPYDPKPEICSDPKCKLEEFNIFAKSIDGNYVYEDIQRKEYDEIDLLLVNSVSHKNCKFGCIDADALESALGVKPSLFLTHHTFLSENNDDVSAMRNAYRVFEMIDKKDILGVLHGHTHGYKDITIGRDCPIIGVGPFLKNVPNVNNQVNLVVATKTGIFKVLNYYYRADLEKYECCTVFSRTNSVFNGDDIEKIYNRVVHDTKYYGFIYNLNLNISMPYDRFNQQIERIFQHQIPVAELWQETKKIPDTLYYNHGQYMQHNGEPAINFVIRELESKATSSRAIIPLINFTQVVNSGDGFLPSFDLVQFGFLQEDKKQLHVTLYLRALEVNHFLKINLCETYLLCKKIYEKIRSIDSVEIRVIAFKAQYKENYGCFARAKIDMLSESKITMVLLDSPKQIADMLAEKMNFNETVVELNGIINIENAIKAIHETRKIKSDVINLVRDTVEIMKDLKLEREKSSNYSSIEHLEKQVVDQFGKTIKIFESGEIYES